MRKRILLLSVIGIASLCMMMHIDNKGIVYEIQLTSEGVSESIKSWIDEESGKNYFFLPSYAKEETMTYDDKIKSNDDIVLVKSENVFTLFITTATGSMDQVYEDKSHKEPISLVIYSEDGKLEYKGENITIKGHGNSSWNADKKPFKLIFEDSISLLNLGAGTEWILQANAYDHTNLKNAIVMDTAKELEIGAVSDYRYVDVYLNGEYNGLYTLVQSVEDTFGNLIGEEDAYLAVSDSTYEAWNESGNHFRIDEYVTAELKRPKTVSNGQLEEIEVFFQMVDSLIKGEIDGELSNYIDTDSWTKKYLIDEIFENFDSGIRSNYFYWIPQDDMEAQIYAGPLWDYDISFGSKGRAMEDPNILYAAQFQRSSSIHLMWYGYLYRNAQFYNSVVRAYRDEFRDVLLRMTESDIEGLFNHIQQSVNMNNLRWNITETANVTDMVSWLKSRIEFLDSIWLEEEPYVVVTIDSGGTYEYFRCFVKKGECLKDNPMFNTYFGNTNSEWRNSETYELIDFSVPIYEDMVVMDCQSSVGSIITKLSNNLDLLLVLASIGILGMVILVLIYVDLRKNGFGDGKYLCLRIKN